MNKHYYSFGNLFKIKFRKHYCYKWGTDLSIITHKKIVSPKSEEAKYYDFSNGVDGGVMVGSCEFIHKVFYCPTCLEEIEFVFQLSFEDLNNFIKKIKRKFFKKEITLAFKKTFETKENKYVDKVIKLEDIQNFCLFIYVNDKEIFVSKFSLLRKKSWERPYYFKINAKEVVEYLNRKLLE